MTRIVDNLFRPALCVHANGDNEGRKPLHVKWEFDVGNSQHTWFTDGMTRYAPGYHGPKVAWLLEPRELHPENYDDVANHDDLFDAVVTHDEDWAEQLDCRRIFAPGGGTRLHPSDWQVHPKTKVMSMVYSTKYTLPGHKLRHEVIEQVSGIDYLGGEVPVRKRDGIVDYMYTIAIENVARKNWFTECLLDPLLAGTVPIYWGAGNLEQYGFDMKGIIPLEVFMRSMTVPSISFYHQLREEGVLERNMLTAMKYQMTEDYLYLNWPELFA